MTEKPAKGVKGFLLENGYTGEFFFRVYNPENRHEFVDYEIRTPEMELELSSKYVSLYEDGEESFIDFSSLVIGSMPKRNKSPIKGLKKQQHKEKQLEIDMGVGFYVNEKRYASWSYSGFNSFRERVASNIGLNLKKMEGFTSIEYKFGLTIEEFDAYKKAIDEEIKTQIKWETINDPLVPFLRHSDCDGELTSEECSKIGPRLKEVLEIIQNTRETLNPFENYDIKEGMGLVQGMEEAAKTGLPLVFC